ncbi:hypothetical protein CLV24_11338 [Pontibacter ummariensis]|uniref:T9SS C-terminal target domain-containing protein n=1 Tax=Pontibacter ummariensis TaxID=1610492 RepID=A0A239HEK5_9BACT|nr:hypothetical protein [Pontibacter ummariensis]PRY10619.1 hypothetical protein CLV24_11338 [Pontibacter ummariensis]SNS79849.1 hypothetical protein SAMN06296052_113117 [Pontibacter ummariensis]
MKVTSKFLIALLLTSSVCTFTSCNDDDEKVEPGIEEPQGQEIVVTESAQGTGTVTWTANNTYILDGFVFVNDGQTLTIEPGTVIKGKPGEGENASALIVARGGKIIAEGTAEKPIIFTALQDDVTKVDDMPLDANGLWGGVIVLGKATINKAGGQGAIEGIPAEEARGVYGGTNDADNSGVLKYVSIRHGGTLIGAGNEINGLTLGGVGSGTTIDYIEVFSNQDDGIEWFGGTVNTKHLVSAFNNDDMFDYDQGWRGNNQFWFGIYNEGAGGTGGEFDGGSKPDDATPFSIPTIANATIIGGMNLDGQNAVMLVDNAGGKIYNSIFADFAGGLVVEDLDDASVGDSRQRLETGDLVFKSNIFSNVADNTFAGITAVAPNQGYLLEHLNANNNRVTADPVLASISRRNNKTLSPLAASGSAALSGATALEGSFFTNVNYIGAFDSSNNWMKGWTYLDQLGYLK